MTLRCGPSGVALRYGPSGAAPSPPAGRIRVEALRAAVVGVYRNCSPLINKPLSVDV